MRLRFGSFELDSEARELRRGRLPVHLSPKALELLIALAEQRPRAMAKRELRDRLWPDAVVVDANLANLVGELRAALGESSRQPVFVRTVPRFGYALRIGSGPGPPCDPASQSEVACRLSWPGGRATLAPGEHVVGRDESARVRLDFASVSRRHAAIRVSASGAVVEDLGSKNGTWVRGARIRSAAALADGDELRIGAVPMRLRIVKRVGSTETGRADPRR